jgi:hypothetical protein
MSLERCCARPRLYQKRWDRITTIYKALHFGLNLISIDSLVSCEPGSHFHFCTASITDRISTGWPPFTSTTLTTPLRATRASTLTIPLNRKLLAVGEYSGTILSRTLRELRAWSSCPDHSGEFANTAPKAIRTAKVSNEARQTQ